ncbi:MAG: hypothetical protein ABGX27_08905 [Desulfurobacteriaceae bacterium]
MDIGSAESPIYLFLTAEICLLLVSILWAFKLLVIQHLKAFFYWTVKIPVKNRFVN